VRGDLRIGRGFLHDRQIKLAKAHRTDRLLLRFAF
jgi:hypothetical protein